MKISKSIDHVRNTALVLGVLAVVPVAAQAMVTDHDTGRVEVGSSADAGDQQPVHPDASLRLRFGAYSGIGVENRRFTSPGQDARSLSGLDDTAPGRLMGP
jgi:hypothetical protein